MTIRDDAEILIEGEFDAAPASGVWKLLAKGGTAVWLEGAWTLRRA